MSARRVSALALVLCLVTVLTGCAFPLQQVRGPQPLPEPQQVFRPLDVGPKNGDLDSLDPALIQFPGDYDKAQLIFPPLVTLDGHNQVVPWAATRWEASSDGLTWTFHLHPGMKWSDGTPIDASTYAYSLNRSLDPCTQSPGAYYLSGQTAAGELIKGSWAFNNGNCPQGQLVSAHTLVGTSIIAVNPLTLQLVLSHPAAYFAMSLTYSTAWAVPKQLIERYGPENDNLYDAIHHNVTYHYGWTDHLADNGGFGGNTFAVKRWDHNGHLDLVRNQAFWGRKPKLREVDWTFYKDLDVLWADFMSGNGDLGAPEDWWYGSELGFIVHQPSAMLVQARKLAGFHQEPDFTMLYLLPNWRIPPFDDARVRQAFSLALNRTAIAHTLWPDETAIPSIHIVPEGVPGYSATLRDAAGRTGAAALTANPEKAKALWLEYVREKWGGDASKAPKVQLWVRCCGPSEDASNGLVAQWRAAMPGLQVETLAREGPSQVHRYGSFQFRPSGWGADYPDPQDFLSLLMHTGAPFYETGISLPSADLLMDQADANPNQAGRFQQYQTAEQLLVDAGAVIPLAQGTHAYVVRPNVAGGYHERSAETAALEVWQRIFITKASSTGH